jgi:GntR family transcriptional regulator/MocR family aminotransferase
MKGVGNILLDRASHLTLQAQITRHLKELIQRGDLRPGAQVPSSRDLATQLNLSRNTVVYAYDRLMSEGFLEPRARSGIYVSSSILPPQRPRVMREPAGNGASEISHPAAKTLNAPAPFRPCQPDVGLFPLLIWNRLRGRALRTLGRNLLHYQASCVSGYPALRENLAGYLRDNRGVRCDWRNVVITAGSQQALYILAKLLLEPGDRVCMGDPGYVEARLAWQHAGARIQPAPVDEKGLQPPTASHSGRRFGLVYTTPSRQFPTGAPLALERRFALIDYAARTKTWIVEDDYDSELRYAGPPLPSLQSLDQSGRVIYVGTFSKLLYPSLRLGYLVVPESLLDGFVRIKHLIDDHLPLIDQATLAQFLESGAFYSHIRRCRKAYAERQAFLLDLFGKSNLPLEFKHTDGGMNLTGFLPEGTDDREWSARLGKSGFDVPSLSSYGLKKTAPGLVFGFTAFDTRTLATSFSRMLKVLR